MTVQDVHEVPLAEDRPVPERPDPSLDWRFLLPSPRLGAVAVGGAATSPDAADRARVALTACATSVIDLDEAGPDAMDTVLLRNPTRRQLQLAVRTLRPFGTIVVEGAPAHRRRRGSQGFPALTSRRRPPRPCASRSAPHCRA